MNKQKVLKNASWIIISRVAQMIITFFIGTVTARYLGPNNYGILSYSESYVVLFASICTLGLNDIIISEVVKNPKNTDELIGTAIVFRVIAGIVSIGLIQIVVIILNPGENLVYMTSFLQSISLVFSAVNIINYWYNSQLRAKTISIVQTIVYLIMAVYKIAILIFKMPIQWFAFSNSLDIIIISIFLVYLYNKKEGRKFKFNYKMGIKLLKLGYPFIVAGIMVTLYQQMDRIMIGKMLGNTSVGYYSAAMKICTIWGFIPIAILDSLKPIVMKAKEERTEIFERRIRQMVAIVSWTCFIFSAVISILSKIIIIVLYGAEYMPARSALVIGIWYTAFSYIGSICHVWLICENKSKYVQIMCLFGSVINFILNIILIPRFGVVGAAIATLLTQITTNIGIPILFDDTRRLSVLIIQGICLININIKQNLNALNNFITNKIKR